MRDTIRVKMGDAMDHTNHFPKLGWTVEELARILSVSVPFLRLEVKRGRLEASSGADPDVDARKLRYIKFNTNDPATTTNRS